MSSPAEIARAELELPKNIDHDYAQSAASYINAQVAKKNSQRKLAHYQSCDVAFRSFFVDGAQYGALLGLGSAMYYRRMLHVPKASLAFGATYGAVMYISALYRFDM